MDTILQFKNVTFAWLKSDAPEDPSLRGPEDLDIIMEDFCLDLPSGMTSLLGPNGVGKTTLLLLAGGRMVPLRGKVVLGGADTARFINAIHDPALEEERNRLAGFVYQNMEFETDMDLGSILEAMTADMDDSRKALLRKGLDALELRGSLGKRPQDMAKGELQRAVIALALHYGSPLVIMDEPVFALEDDRKHRVFSWLRDYCHESRTSILYSAHDFDLCKQYADTSLLIWRENGQLHHELGSPQAVCSDANLERAYRAPMVTLHQKDRLYRQMLMGDKA